MAGFRMRHNRLRGSTSSRLRGGAATNGTIYPGCAVAGLVPSVRAATTMVPGPRPRVGVVLPTPVVTPTVRAGILKRDPVTVSMGSLRTPRVAPNAAGTPRATIGSVRIPPTVLAPAIQNPDDVTGQTPDVGTPTATVVTKVPGQVTGTPDVPKPVSSPGRSC